MTIKGRTPRPWRPTARRWPTAPAPSAAPTPRPPSRAIFSRLQEFPFAPRKKTAKPPRTPRVLDLGLSGLAAWRFLWLRSRVLRGATARRARMFRGRVRHVHFVGTGGIGMSGLAEIL